MAYPATLELDASPEVANWRPLVQWLLAIPHLLIAQALQQVAEVVALISWFAIVFTGELPAGLASFQCLAIRYSARAYSYAFWLREPYPPFEFTMTGTDPGTDPVRVELQPALTDRNRLTVGLRFIWAIPAALFAIVLGIAASVALLVGFFAVLFTGRWPQGLRDFVVGCGRYFVRFTAYVYLLTDEYPPFALE
jgi:hypothetical protein